MMLALIVFFAAAGLELSMWIPVVWKGRKFLAGLCMGLVVVSTSWLVVERLAPWTVLVAIFSLYRCLNLGRIISGRLHADHLYYASLRTTGYLIALQAGTIGLAVLGQYFTWEQIIWWDILASVQLICGMVVLASTLRHLETTRKPRLVEELPASKLPSLTVAIPARNETADLEACLRTLAVSTYPKLEIIVLDDCSQNKRTPEIIRSFAHSGVRFIAGAEPPESWLAKNYAYSQLADEANGELLLFCGVDTRFHPDSLTHLVNTMLKKNKSMLSVLPKNKLPAPSDTEASLIQPSRYAWELGLPRRLIQRPPVLSTCWLITRAALKSAGGFGAVRRKGVPESYFAKATAQKDDGYTFVQSDEDIGLTSEKSAQEQRATAVRTRYLQLHRRPEMVAVVGLTELALLLWPVILAVVAILGGEVPLAAVAGLSFALQAVAYGKIVNLTYRVFTLRSLFLLPAAVLYDVGLLNYSMWQYEFREVLWKGRNVCIPIMQAIPTLPKI